MTAGHRQAYQSLLGELDAFFARVARSAGDRGLRCNRGCSDCCQRDLTLLPIELDSLVVAALALRQTERSAVWRRARRAADDPQAPCPLLSEGSCAVYPRRPAICRSHGLPLLLPSTPGARPELSFCPHNLGALRHFSGDWVLDLAPVQEVLTAANRLYCQERSEVSGHRAVAVTLRQALAPGWW